MENQNTVSCLVLSYKALNLRLVLEPACTCSLSLFLLCTCPRTQKEINGCYRFTEAFILT